MDKSVNGGFFQWTAQAQAYSAPGIFNGLLKVCLVSLRRSVLSLSGGPTLVPLLNYKPN